MKRKTLKILTCVKCGESDYGDCMNTIDGKIYCQMCSDNLLDADETRMIEEGMATP